jgi:hypothetical protein
MNESRDHMTEGNSLTVSRFVQWAFPKLSQYLEDLTRPTNDADSPRNVLPAPLKGRGMKVPVRSCRECDMRNDCNRSHSASSDL